MTLSAFFMAAILLAITPGPGVAYVVARTVAGGKGEGLASTVGTAIGGMLHVVAAALGVSLLIAQSAVAFAALKYLGAAYLIYLGIQMLLRKPQAVPVKGVIAKGSRRALVDGILVELLNVKTALFFLAFLPQFVTPGESVAAQLAVLGTVCVALNTSVDVIAVLASSKLLHSSATRAARERLLTKVSGCTMIFLGMFLALAKRSSP